MPRIMRLAPILLWGPTNGIVTKVQPSECEDPCSPPYLLCVGGELVARARLPTTVHCRSYIGILRELIIFIATTASHSGQMRKRTAAAVSLEQSKLTSLRGRAV